VDLSCIVSEYKTTLKVFVDRLGTARAHFVYGPRKSGKSALIQAFGEFYQFPIVTLNREIFREAELAGIGQSILLKGSLSYVLAIRPAILVIDELQDMLCTSDAPSSAKVAETASESRLPCDAWRFFLRQATLQLEKLTEEEQVHLVIVSSAPQKLGRLDLAGITSRLCLQLPDGAERAVMVSRYVSSPEVARQTVRATAGYLLADLARVLQQATVIASHGQEDGRIRNTTSTGSLYPQDRRKKDRDKVSLVHVRSAMRLFPQSVDESYYKTLAHWEQEVFPEPDGSCSPREDAEQGSKKGAHQAPV